MPDVRKLMRIGQMSRQTGVSIDAIRFYERNGLLAAPARSDGGFRLYSHDDLSSLQFIRNLQTLGFSLNEVREFVSLRTNDFRACSAVRKMLDHKLRDIHAKRIALSKLEDELKTVSIRWYFSHQVILTSCVQHSMSHLVTCASFCCSPPRDQGVCGGLPQSKMSCNKMQIRISVSSRCGNQFCQRTIPVQARPCCRGCLTQGSRSTGIRTTCLQSSWDTRSTLTQVNPSRAAASTKALSGTKLRSTLKTLTGMNNSRAPSS
jgi:MerR family transcriptional regulator, mercuric resistance operon regulatory protein